MHTYDYNNRLTQSTNGTKTITYAYDSSGNRISKTDGANITYYPNKYYEIENGVVSKHLYAGNDKIATINNGQTYYHHTDHLGGSNLETDNSGVGVELVDYYPFGQVRIDSKANGLNYQNNYKFTGKELDTDTDLYYYGARYYDGKIGRFVGEDNAFWAVGTPALKQITGQDLKQYLSDPQGLNSYAYARNNPLKYTDPTGQFFGETGRSMANDQRNIASFFNNLADYSRQNITGFGQVAGLAYNAVGSLFNSASNVFDPDAGVGTRALGLGMVALDVGSGGESGAVKTSVSSVVKTGTKTSEVLNLSLHPHAVERMMSRNITDNTVINTVKNGESFNYFHAGLNKVGYFDKNTRTFVAKVGNEIRTVINNVKDNYIKNLKNTIKK